MRGTAFTACRILHKYEICWEFDLDAATVCSDYGTPTAVCRQWQGAEKHSNGVFAGKRRGNEETGGQGSGTSEGRRTEQCVSCN